MADGQMNIRVNVDLNDMRRKAEEYRKEVTKMGVITDESGNVISTAWQRVSEAEKKSNIGRIAEEMTGDVSANIEIQKKVLKDLEEQYKSVSKAIENAAPGIAKSKLQQELSAIKKEIDGEKQALQELEKVQQQYGQSNLTLRTQIYNVRNEMGRLRIQGQTNTEQYRQLEAELGRLGTAYRQLQYEQKALSTGATQWGGIISGIQGLTGAFAAAQGVIGLFVTDNEKLAKIQTRLQAVMAITIGMQQVSNTLHETSAFRMTTVRRVTELFTGAQTKLATALGISTLKAQILMGTLTLGLSAAITGIIYLINKWSSAQKKAAEEQKKIVEIQKRSAEGTGEQIAIYEKLKRGWNELGDDLEAKKKYITDNKDEMDKLGIAVNGVNDAENLFVLNGDKFIKALLAKTKAIASMEIATEKYKDAISTMAESQTNALENIRREIINQKGADIGEKIFESIRPMLDEKNSYAKIMKELKSKGIDKGFGITGVFTESYIEYKKGVENFEKKGEEVERFLKEQADSLKDYGNILKGAGFTTTEEDKAKKEAAKAQKEKEDKERKAAEARKKVLEKINDELLALERENQQSQISLMEEGSEKELAQIEKDYDEKISKIKELAKKWASEQQGALTTKQAMQIETAYTIANQQKTSDIANVHKKESEELDKLISKYQDYDTKRREIEEKFSKDMQSLESKRTPSNSKQIASAQDELKEKRNQALSEIANEFASRSEEFELWMNEIATYSLEHLYETLREAEAELGKLKIAGIGGNQLAQAQAKVDSIKSQISKNIGRKDEGPNKRSIKEWQELHKTLSVVNNQFKEIGDNVGGVAGEIIKSASGIASSTLSMIDGIKTLANSSSSAMHGTANAAAQSISTVEKASVILAIISAALQIAMQMYELFKKDDGKADYEALKGQLEEIDKIYGRIIDKSKEKIVFGGGFAAVDAAREANEILDKQIENYRKLAEKGGNIQPSSSHSYVHRANERLKGDFASISKAIGKNISSMQDMYNLTGEQLYIIQTKFPEAWSKIPSEITEPLNKIIECREESEKLASSLNEALTGVSFDNFYNGFIDSLANMDASFEDMCDNFEEYLRKSIIAGLIANQYKGRIEKLYESWTEAAESGNEIDEREAKKLRGDYQDIIQDMIKDRDNLAKTFEWETSEEEKLKRQTGTITETITEKTANESMGIWRGSYDTLKAINQQTTMFHETYKSTMATCNSILNTIARNTGETANNTSVLSDMHSTLKSMDGRLRTIESESSKRYAR